MNNLAFPSSGCVGGGSPRSSASVPVMDSAETEWPPISAGEIATGLTRGEFWLAFQPILDVRTGGIAGAEALLRWNHPRFGHLLPGSFLSKVGPDDVQIKRRIADFVVEALCAQAGVYQRSNVKASSQAYVSFNVEPTLLLDADFSEGLKRQCMCHGVDPSRLVVEILETEYASHVLSLDDALQPLREMGVRLALDDFGAGYCSLARIASLGVDKVKVSRELMRNLSLGTRGHTVLTVLLELLRKLDVDIVVEGVETVTEARWLRRNRVSEMQGFYFSRPLPDLVSALTETPEIRSRLARAGIAPDEVA
ncbi:EAL domain-containing protein [Pandoraea pnomenusa]|uniref:EAL domain-containing protein n=1 Tax=Pandoraea pnomenusa TaxID=93220 RepID=UPI003342CBC2